MVRRITTASCGMPSAVAAACRCSSRLTRARFWSSWNRNLRQSAASSSGRSASRKSNSAGGGAQRARSTAQRSRPCMSRGADQGSRRSQHGGEPAGGLGRKKIIRNLESNGSCAARSTPPPRRAAAAAPPSFISRPDTFSGPTFHDGDHLRHDHRRDDHGRPPGEAIGWLVQIHLPAPRPRAGLPAGKAPAIGLAPPFHHVSVPRARHRR